MAMTYEHLLRRREWSRAATLKERAASQRNWPKVDYDSEAAERRLAEWRSDAPFDSGDCLRCRLATVGIGNNEILQLLGESAEALQQRIPAAWLHDIEEAFSSASPTDSLPLSISEQIESGFVRPLEPLLRLAHRRLGVELQQLVHRYPKPPFDPVKTGELLLSALSQQFARIVTRSFVLELNIARMEERLTGQTPEERFESFVELSSRPDEALRLLSEYPVLARQLVMSIERWLDTNVEFLSHLCIDWRAIREVFCGGNDPGVIDELSSGAGDTHRGGRSVRIARFASGLRVVYKPRSLAIDRHFQELLGWLNDRGASPRFPLLKVLDQGDHGWQEFVSSGTCHSIEAVDRFYAREGAYLALLYSLAATDFHRENLIAAGENPVLVDLEAVFHPRFTDIEPPNAEDLAASELRSSVVATGLLPQRMGLDRPGEGLDLSGMGAAGGQLSPWESPYIEGYRTDHMHLIRKRLTTSEDANRPTLDGGEVKLLDYQSAILDGFTRTYRLLLAHRDDLLSEDGPLVRMRGDEVRVILRPTRSYAQLLFESYHPDVLRDALDRDRLLDRLWLAVPGAPHLEKTAGWEHEDLLQGDIPLFTTRPGSRDLWHGGCERLPEFFHEPPINGQRVAQLSEADLTRQTWLVGASLATLSDAARRMRPATMDRTRKPCPVSRERLLAVAREAGDRLIALALRRGGSASWLGLSYIEERRAAVWPVGIDLYEGLCGITLFLGYLGAITGETRYSELSRAGLAMVDHHVGQAQPGLRSVGGYAGWGGVIYTMANLAVLWDDPALISKAESVVELVPALIEEDTGLDLISGSAGCALALLALYRVRPSAQTLAAVVQCGEWLLKHRLPMHRGIGWVGNGGPEPLSGVSHGASGFAFALFSLFGATGDDRFRTAALQALEYERSLFREDVGNWLDLMQSSVDRGVDSAPRATFHMAWCHGAPGIGLARLKLLPHLQDDPFVQEEIRTALLTTISHGFGGDHSLCHGDAGFLDLLLEASQILEEPRWNDELLRFMAGTLDSIKRDGWICGVPLGIEVPGLMTGIAGIGYECLRLAAPSLVPSVLLLESAVGGVVAHAA